MILSRHTTICDSCGTLGPTSDQSHTHAQARAIGIGWTTEAPTLNIIGNEHWCPTCTAARKDH